MQDNIYNQLLTQVPPFEFDESVVAVFSDMIARSVPGYTLTLPLIGLMAARYAQPHSNIYDLGCSLGAATFSIRDHLPSENYHIIGVDNSPAMIASLQEKLQQHPHPISVQLVEGDIRQQPIENASMVVLNFTLQFIDPEDRNLLIKRIADGMRENGILIVSEKVIFADKEQHERFIDIHHDFKRANGYSDLEISQKRTAIENVLIPETLEQHETRILEAGFRRCERWFQALNFASLLAIK